MTAADWAALKHWFNAVMDAEPSEARRLIETLEGQSPELAVELRSLLDEHRSAELHTAAVLDGRQPRPEAATPAAEVGPYRLLRELGRGGAGVVFLAERADDEFHRPVALKLLRYTAWDRRSEELLTAERRVLTQLQHANIATLIDWGTTADGAPWLAVEYVDGEPIDAYCRTRALDVAATLAIFEQVCQAVQYAHRRLVVHRDLKPANILVTAGGTVKLLDFGIAKLMEEQSVTATVERRFTPAYASPEQIEGLPVTAASDVYALGLLLYELLTGKLPHGGDTIQELARRLEDRPAAPPSETGGLAPDRRRAMRGDLDRIVLHAIERDPERRYPSVEQLLADVERLRDGYPIAARGRSTVDRGRKFVRRNALPVGAAALAAVALIVGAAVAISQARVARRQQAAAERRFKELQRLAHSVMFDLHDAIRAIPGATEARRTLVATALEYLDGLNAEHIADDSLQQELAGAYYRMAWVQGGLGSQNLGDSEGSRRSYETALRILDGLWTKHEGDLKIGALRFAVAYNFSLSRNDPADGAETAGRYSVEAQGWADRSPNSASLNAAALLLQAQGRLRNRTGDFAGALEAIDRADVRLRQLQPYAVSERPVALGSEEVTARGVLHALAISAAVRAGTLLDMNRVDEALAANREFLRLEQQAQGVDANSPAAAGMLLTDRAFLSDAALALGHARDAAAEARAEIAGMEAAVSADPAEISAQRDLADAHRHLGNALCALGDRRGGAAELARAAEALSRIAAKDPGLLLNRANHAATLNDYGNAAASRAAFRDALAILDDCLRLAPHRAELIRERARSYAGLGDTQRSAADWAEFRRRSPLYHRMPAPLPY